MSFPDTDTPFVDATDVVRRLLPYHIFQHPLDDLNGVTVDPSGKGKAKATGQDLLREEIAGMFFLCYFPPTRVDKNLLRNEVCFGVFSEAEGTPGSV